MASRRPEPEESVTGLAASLVSVLTGEPPSLTSPLGDVDPVDRIVLMVLDGFGWDQVVQALHAGLMPALVRLKEEGRAAMRPLWTVFPSMTPVVLPSIVTGTYPSVHGIVGQVVTLAQGPVDVLHEPWPDPDEPALCAPDLAVRLEAAGLAYDVLLDHRLRTGPLTEILHGRTKALTTFIAASGFPVLLDKLLDQKVRGAIYAYWSAIDAINHQRGAFNVEWQAEVAAVDGWLGRLSAGRRPGVRFWITADHGHVPLHRALRYYELREELPWLPERPAEVGNGIGLALGATQVDQVGAAVERRYPGQIEIWDVAERFYAGRFGPPGDGRFQARVGTHLLWAKQVGDHWMTRADRIPHHSSHGGLSDAEMAVPWIEVRLD